MNCFPYHEFLTAGLVNDYEPAPMTRVNTILFTMNFKEMVRFNKESLPWWDLLQL